ncbi:MAG: TIR domain-containing protein, partial [Pseudomonadota bacterium]
CSDPALAFGGILATGKDASASRDRIHFRRQSRGARKTVEKKKQAKTSAKPKTKRVRVSQQDVPAFPLEEALRVARAIYENYGGDPTKPLEVAAAMDMKPGSSHFKMLTGSSIAYGLTDGGYNASEIAITPLATKILRPLEEGADVAGKREAFQKPRVISEFLQKYNESPIPKNTIAKNVLASMGVPDDRTEATLESITAAANELGLIREIKGTQYINLSPTDGYVPEVTTPDPSSNESTDSVVSPPVNETPANSIPNDTSIESAKNPASTASNRKVFITHGKNQAFIQPIRKLLEFGEMEAVVSVEKQSVSKPVPDKVMTDMRDCGAAIIHVEDELKLIDKDAKEHVVLNPNVLIEIGAAMALYGRRFILLVKDGVNLPSNLQGLYEVRYTGSSLDGDATIKLLEAIKSMKGERAEP